MMNSVRGRPKLSQVERDTGRYVFLMLLTLLLICFWNGLWYASWAGQHREDIFTYIDIHPHSFLYNFFVRAGNWLLILGNFVPISLLVSLELTKLFQAKLIGIDRGLISSNGVECKVNTSALNEELGQIDFIFSDKTGTLTRNEMRFKFLVIGDKSYGENTGYTGEMKDVKNVEFSDPAAWEAIEAKGSTPESQKFLDAVRMLSLCHTIIVEKNGDYSAASPDELALVGFAKLVGSEFKGLDDDNNMQVDEYGTLKTYKLLEIFEFSSDRKRMSAIVEDEEGVITLYTKGADTIMIPRLANADSEEVKNTLAGLDKQAEVGFRTLLLASKTLTKEDYNEFKVEYEVEEV